MFNISAGPVIAIWILMALTCRGLEEKSTTVSTVPPVDALKTPALASSFAPMVKKSARSVVNIFTSRQVKAPELHDMPFFNDPIFRKFFDQDKSDHPSTQKPVYRKQRSLGSGVVIAADGYILTNYHVVEDADEIKVVVPTSREEVSVKLVGRDQGTDIALLKIEGQNFSPIDMGDSDHVEVGDVVLAIGNPFGVGQTVTMGIISGVGRKNLKIEDYEDFLQTDAAINVGNSGGALINAQGQLIGINTAILSGSGGSQGVGFAIPINLARYITDQLKSKGRVIRGYLGIGIQELTPDLAQEFHVQSGNGVLVTSVEPKSAAARAGVSKGDVITEYNSKPVSDPGTLRLMVSQESPNARATLKIWRDGKERTHEAVLQELTEKKILVAAIVPVQNEGGSISSGMAIATPTPEMRRKYEVPDEITGVLITGVTPGSPAGEAGLSEGDVIQSINRENVKTDDDALAAMKKAHADRLLLLIWHRGTQAYVLLKGPEKAKQ